MISWAAPDIKRISRSGNNLIVLIDRKRASCETHVKRSAGDRILRIKSYIILFEGQ